LRIINVSDPSNPYEVGYCDTPDWAWGVVISGSYAYVADCESGLRIINISDPSNPYEVGYCDTPGYANGVVVVDSLAYVADQIGGLRIVNVADPSNPYEVGCYYTSGWPENVALLDTYAFIAAWHGGLRMIDISDPSNPYEVGYYDTPDNAVDVNVIGANIYVADAWAGLQIYENLLYGINEAETMISNPGMLFFQNPIRGNHIEFWLQITQIGTPVFSFYNTLGQRIKKFSLSQVSSTKRLIRIPTKGLPSGVYFLKFETEDYTETKKLILLR